MLRALTGYSYLTGSTNSSKFSKVHLSGDDKVTLCGKKIEVWYFKTAETDYCSKCEKAAKEAAN